MGFNFTDVGAEVKDPFPGGGGAPYTKHCPGRLRGNPITHCDLRIQNLDRPAHITGAEAGPPGPSSSEDTAERTRVPKGNPEGDPGGKLSGGRG